LKLITPLWAGGINNKKNNVWEIKSSGIIGSLRWWYEAIKRGEGKAVCNVLRDPCEKNSLCDVCKIFGNTDKRRSFILRIDSSKLYKHNIYGNFRPNGRRRGWYLPRGLVGELKLTFIGPKETISEINFLMHFLEKYGGLGSKQQMGYGTFIISEYKLVEPKNVDSKFIKSIRKLNLVSNNNSSLYPNIANFKIYEFKLDTLKIRQLYQNFPTGPLFNKNGVPNNPHPMYPIIKNYLRYKYHPNAQVNKGYFFGYVSGNNRMKGKLYVSWAFVDDEKKMWHFKILTLEDLDNGRWVNKLTNWLINKNVSSNIVSQGVPIK